MPILAVLGRTTW